MDSLSRGSIAIKVRESMDLKEKILVTKMTILSIDVAFMIFLIFSISFVFPVLDFFPFP
jgi:hypothetical protein